MNRKQILCYLQPKQKEIGRLMYKHQGSCGYVDWREAEQELGESRVV